MNKKDLICAIAQETEGIVPQDKIVVILNITPTSDVFTLSLVALLMWMLYEVGIFIVKKSRISI